MANKSLDLAGQPVRPFIELQVQQKTLCRTLKWKVTKEDTSINFLPGHAQENTCTYRDTHVCTYIPLSLSQYPLKAQSSAAGSPLEQHLRTAGSFQTVGHHTCKSVASLQAWEWDYSMMLLFRTAIHWPNKSETYLTEMEATVPEDIKVS